MRKLLSTRLALVLTLTLILTLSFACCALAETAAGEPAEAAAEEVVEETAEEAADAPAEAEAAVETAAEEAAEEAEAEAEEEEEPAPSLPMQMFGKLLELPWYTFVIIAALIAAGIILAKSQKRVKWNSRLISTAAMCIAISFVLSCIRLYRMPQGGSITPASMLPLIMFMLACGPLKGFVVGCAFGLLDLISDPYIIHPIQMLVDYPLAFGAMILACLAARIPVKAQWKLPIAVALGFVGRYIMAVLSGTVFFAEYAGDQNALIYSLVYNVSYLGPDMLVCMIIACIPGMTRIVDMIRKNGK